MILPYVKTATAKSVESWRVSWKEAVSGICFNELAILRAQSQMSFINEIKTYSVRTIYVSGSYKKEYKRSNDR